MKSEGEKFTDYLEEQELKTLQPYALRSRERRNQLGKYFREHKPRAPLEFRTEYHRDRDRILWSKSFKRLQHKTQVFPHYVEDHYKRRLTHSLEVSQIATTIARSLNLNQIATEAIALGHDLGHTPFGHAGERALSEKLISKVEELKKENKINNEEAPSIPTFGFDHCVHGIEVVSRIEREYINENQYGGLDLTFDVRDGILKHMFDYSTPPKGRPFSKISKVADFPAYRIFRNNKGSLEAQCVYFADKVAYLLGDIEDGIRSDILRCEEIEKDELFKELRRKYKHYRGRKATLTLTNKDQFISFRSKALTVLILDCINNAKKNLKKNPFSNVDDVLSSRKRVVFVSHDLSKLWTPFYKKWMREYLFRNRYVVACTFKAATIMKGLFDAYFENIDLIKEEYQKHCRKTYKKIGISEKNLLKLIMVRNYIAGMTDAFAIDQHARLYMSSERIRF